MNITLIQFFLLSLLTISWMISPLSVIASDYNKIVFQAGHDSLQHWLMPDVPVPPDNELTPERIELGKKLFFDPRLSGDGNMSCATCHNPLFGWSDGFATAKGVKSKILDRATPTVINTAYQKLQMWDGRKHSLEDQALGPIGADVEMNMGVDAALEFLNGNVSYKTLFTNAYPNEDVSAETLAKAIASFERTVVSNDSRFDRWIKGNSHAMTNQEINGFKLFVNPEKGNCAVCHSAPNFTDDSFHNIGLASYGSDNPDMGRYAIKPVAILKGAFKTPTLREINRTAPYFHDGSAINLGQVVDHYVAGGSVKTDLSPTIKPLTLSDSEKADLVAFMKALSSDEQPVTLPLLPH